MQQSSTFYVLSKNGNQVKAKYLFDSNGNPVIDPVTNDPYIVPADYDPQVTIDHFHEVLVHSYDNVNPDNPDFGAKLNVYQALVDYFKQGAPGDLQRYYNGSRGDFVPAFTDAASFNFGLGGAAANVPDTEIYAGGGLYNFWNSLHPGGEYINTTDIFGTIQTMRLILRRV